MSFVVRGKDEERETELKIIVQIFQQSCSLAMHIQVQSNPKYHTHTETHSQPPTLCPWCPFFIRVCGYCPGASKAAGWLGLHSVHSPVKPALQALFLRTEPLAEQKQMWAPSPLFLHLGSASSPPQILSHTQKNWNFSRNRWSGSFSPSFLLLRHCQELRGLEKPDVYYKCCMYHVVFVNAMWDIM